MSVKLGAVREVWFAATSDPTNKYSFLVRDDSYVMQEASFGRQVRLGSPIDLGPDSSWNQTGWFGGYDQERWFDEYMFEAGNADVTDRVGRIKMWPTFEILYGSKDRPEACIGEMLTSGTGSGDDTPLLTLERRRNAGYTSAPGGWRVVSTMPLAPDIIGGLTYDPMAIAPLEADDPGGASSLDGRFLIGCRDGRVYMYDQTAGTIAADTGAPAADVTKPVGHQALIGYNGSTYYGRGNILMRRSFNNTGTPTHTEVKTLAGVTGLRSLVVWQNRIWFLGIASGGRTALFTSDGVTAVSVIDFPPGFVGWTLHAHYGSLYVGGEIGVGTGGETIAGQVWRYNGASLTKLWEEEEPDDALQWGVRSMCSWDRFVAWGRHGSDLLGRKAGLWLYDAEEDALLEGPSMDMDANGATHYLVTSVAEWNGSVAIAIQDQRTITAGTYDYPKLIAALRKDGQIRYTPAGTWDGQSFGYTPATVTQYVTSSTHDADLPGEDKVWQTGFIRCKLPANTQVRIAVNVDGGTGTEVTVATITSNGDLGWRNERFRVDDSLGEHLVGVTLNYTVYLENTDTATDSTANPEIDFIGFQYRPLPDRRRQWYMRVLASDGQERLDGTPNPLSTRQAIVDAITLGWASNVPLLFWEASASAGSSGSGSGIRVSLSGLMEQSFRLDTNSDEVMSELSFTLLEEVDPTV